MGFIGKQPAKAAMTSSDITDGIVSADKLASNAVTTAKINADAVTDAKIADDVVGTEHLTAGEVDTTALGADAVTAAKIADDAISDEHLDPTAITGQTAETSAADDDLILLSDTSASAALKKMTRSNFLSGVGGTNTPTFYASLSSNQSISSNTWTKITLDQEVFDADNVFASNKFTVPSAGKYLIITSIRCDTPNAGENFQSAIYKNGSYFNGVSNAREFAQSNNHEIILKCSVILSLAQNDYLELYARAANGNESISGSTAQSGEETYTAMQGFKIIE